MEIHREEEPLGDEGADASNDVSIEVHTDENEKETSQSNLNDSLADISDTVGISEELDTSCNDKTLDSSSKDTLGNIEPGKTVRQPDDSYNEDKQLNASLTAGNVESSKVIPVDATVSSNLVQVQVLSEVMKDEDGILAKDDSVSMSYTTFSRFNRRNRKGSESGEESEVESVSSKESSKCSKAEDSESGIDSVGCLIGDIEELESELVPFSDLGKDKESDKESDKKHNSAVNSQGNTQAVTSTKSFESVKHKQSSLSSLSSVSDTDSESSSSRQPSPKTASKPLSKLIKQKEKVKSRSKSPPSKLTRESETSHRKVKDSCITTADRDKSRDSNKDRKSESSRSDSLSKDNSDFKQVKHDKNRTKKGYDSKKPERFDDKRNKSALDVKADPEFDAANYRDKKFYESKYKQSDNRKSLKGDKDLNKMEKLGRETSGDRERTRESKTSQDEVRYFKDIGKRKIDERKGDASDRRNNDQKTSRNYENERKEYKRQRSTERQERFERKSRSPIPVKRKGRSDEQRKLPESVNRSDSGRKGRSQKNKDEVRKAAAIKQFNRRSQDRDLKRQKSSEKLQKRKSIEEKLKSVVDMSSDSSDSEDSAKSVSSLSDSSSDSEAETWRDKKQGGSRKSFDLELERKQRKMKVRQAREEQERERRAERRKETQDRGSNRDWRREGNREDRGHSGSDGYRDRKLDNNSGKKVDSDSGFGKRNKEDFYNDKNYSRQKLHHKDVNKRSFENRDTGHGKKFEEISSGSDSDTKGKGIVSVIRNDRTKSDGRHISDLNVSKAKTDSKTERVSKSEKVGRLVIQVQRSSEDEDNTRETFKKKLKLKKVKKRKSSFEEAIDEKGDHSLKTQQVVNISFDGGGKCVLQFDVSWFENVVWFNL